MTVADPATTLIREIEIDAPAEKIFDALTDPDQLVKWWGSKDSYRCEKMERGLRVGGRWRVIGTTSTGEPVTVEGTYRAIERPRVLEYTWRPSYEGPNAVETLVQFEITERDGVAHVRVTHSGFTSAESKADHDQGWGQVLSWLRDYVQWQ